MNEESTSDLRNILNNTSLNEINKYLNEHASVSSARDIYNDHLNSYPITIAAIAKNCNGYIARSYVYDIVNGVKAHPSRDIVIMICLAAHMNPKQVRRLLEIYNYRELYPKDDRDALIATCFNSKEYNITTVNNLLYIRQLPLLSNKEEDV